MECRVVGAAIRLMLGVTLVFLSLGTWAQDGKVTPADDAIASIEQRIATADSAQDAVTGASLRLELVELVKSYQGLKLLQEAAGLLDSAAGSPELALRVHRDLADRYTALKSNEKANREWAEVSRLTEVLREEAVTAVEKAEFLNAVAKGRIDSLTTALGVQRAASSNALEAMAAEHERRSDRSLIVIGGGVLALLLSVLFFGVYIRLQRAELKGLRQEVTWLRMVSKRSTEPTVVASSVANAPPKTELPEVLKPAPATPPVREEPNVAFNPEEDAVLLALVRRRAEERLQTLRDARSRGDVDKVLRVVHSLKPQLVSLDGAYFTELCGRLVTSDPRTDPARWAADLDRFEAGMARVIGPGV